MSAKQLYDSPLNSRDEIAESRTRWRHTAMSLQAQAHALEKEVAMLKESRAASVEREQFVRNECNRLRTIVSGFAIDLIGLAMLADELTNNSEEPVECLIKLAEAVYAARAKKR